MIEVSIATIILLSVFSFNIYTNYFHYKFYLLFVLFNIAVSYALFINYNIFYAIFALYCLSNSAHYFLYLKPKHFYNQNNIPNPSLAHMTASAYVTLLVACFGIILINKSDYSYLIPSMKILLGINIVLTLIPAKYTYFKLEGVSDHKAPICGFDANISTNASLLSLMAPFAMINFADNIYLNSSLLALTFIAIIKTSASIGFVAFVSSTLIFLIFFFKFPLVLAPIVFVSFLAMGVFTVSKLKPSTRLFSVSGRDNIFRFTEKWIKPKMNKLTGLGFGSMRLIFVSTHQELTSQKLNQFRVATYIWLHSDIYQLFIEGGWIGLTLGGLAYAYAIYLCLVTSNFAGLAFLVSYFVNSLANFPNHLVPDIVVIVLMFGFIQHFPL